MIYSSRCYAFSSKRMILWMFLCYLCIAHFACSLPDSNNDTEFDREGIELAIPLINTKVSMSTITDRLEGNTAIVIDDEGKPTIKYKGDILAQRAEDIFPAFPGIIDIIIPNPNSTWNLDEVSAFTSAFENNIIRRAIFLNNNMTFRVQHSEAEPITFDITIPTITSDDVPFRMTYTIPPKANEADIHRTESVSVDGMWFTPINNNIQFEYVAKNAQGEIIELDYAAMNLDFFNFSYIEGYFDERVYDIQGDIIEVGLFDKWLSGGLEFEQPQLSIIVENSFGFPVKTDFKKLEVFTVTGNQYDIESSIIDDGVIFNYPSLNEVGEVKFTDITFEKSNSNIGQVFLDKVSSVSYDIDALTNPGGSSEDNGFMNKDSYFKIVASVDIPLKGIVSELIVTDTVEVDIADYDEVENGELKFVMHNEYPVEVKLDMYALDENGNTLDDLFEESSLSIAGADVDETGRTISAKETVQYLPVDSAKINRLKKASKIAIVAYMDSQEISDEALWIYDDYELDLKVGARLNIK